jgi:DNA repair protein SbcD/Mre11
MVSVKIAHFSDLHFCEKHLKEVQRCFSSAVTAAIVERVDVAVVSGDATDHELALHSPAVTALAAEIRRLTDHCPVLMLQGTYSHEPPGTLNVFRMLGGIHPVYVADAIEQVALDDDGRWIGSQQWRFKSVPARTKVLFSCLPTVNKADVAAVQGALHAAEGVGVAIDALLKGWRGINGQARDAGIATVGVSHGTVVGCVTEHGVPMAGLDHEFSVSGLFNAGASAFMLGHIHKHQLWADSGRLIAYAGSIGRLHYGELGEKGFLVWDVDQQGSKLRQLSTPAKRTLDLEFDGAPDLEKIRGVANQAAGAFVRVRWTSNEEDRHSVDKAAIQAALSAAAEVKMEGRVVPIARSRAQGIGQTVTIADKIARWATVIGVEASGVTGRLSVLQSSEVEEVIRGVVDELERRTKACAVAGVFGVDKPRELQGCTGKLPSPTGRADRELVEVKQADLFGT